MAGDKLSDTYYEEQRIRSEVNQAVRTTGYYTYSEEQQLLRKVDIHLMPLLVLIHLLKNLDNNNIGYVAIMNQGTDSNVLKALNFRKEQWAWNATVYFVPYILFQFPSTVLFKVSTPRIHQFRMAFLWGTVTACQAAVTNKAGLLSLRFLLGFFQAGMYPGMLAQLVYWYRPDEVAGRFAVFGVLEPFSNILTALITYGLGFADGKGNLSGWQWVFVLEGAVTVVASLAFVMWQPNFPDDSSWLTEEEKAFLIARLPPQAPRATDKNFVLADVWSSLRKPITVYLMLTRMFQELGSAGPKFWTPSLLGSFNFTAPQEAALITIPPMAVAVMSGVGFSYLVDQTWIAIPVLVTGALGLGVICFIILPIMTKPARIFPFVNLSLLALSADLSPIAAWMATSLHGTTEVGFAFAMADSLAQIGGLAAPHLFQDQFAPQYTQLVSACTAFIFAAFVLSIVAWRVGKDDIAKVREERRVKLMQNKSNCHLKPVYKDE